MKSLKALPIILAFITTISFGASVKEGPEYLKNSHYKVGKDRLLDGTIYTRDYELRFWSINNFGANLSDNKLINIANYTSKLVKKASKTHKAKEWYWNKIKNNQYLMIGYHEGISGGYTFVPIKRIDDKWRYSCDVDSWFLAREGDYNFCESIKGNSVIRFEFFIPLSKKGWSGDEILYRFSIGKED